MPATDREITLRRVASAVASRYLRASFERVAAWNMDMLARLSLLEGAAGVSPGTWLRQKSRGFGMALDHFGPKLAAAWTSPLNQGIYDQAVSAASRILRQVSGEDPLDVVQDAMSGSSSPSGPARNRVFYAVGNALRKYGNDLTAGDMTPSHRRVKGTLERWVSRLALDVARSKKEQAQVYDPSTRTLVSPRLDDDKRARLLLLALQSPGHVSSEVRRVIDEEIDRSFKAPERPIVRAFLEKIGQPKYRSPKEMERMLSRFSPDKWFSQAYNLVHREIASELNLSSQQVTNALGGKAKKVFRFMRERVGKNPRVKRIISDLADSIELKEPAMSHVAKEEVAGDVEPKLRHSVMRRWLEEKEREANLTSGNAFANVDDEFEMNEHKDWDSQSGPHVQHSRGPSPLKVAQAWTEASKA